MQQSSTAMKATGGRDASRERRAQLAQGKKALPPPAERSRSGERNAVVLAVVPPQTPRPVVPTAPAPAAAGTATAPVPVTERTSSRALSGREASRARRAALVQGKAALQNARAAMNNTVVAAVPAASMEAATASESSSSFPVFAAGGRMAAQAMRIARARNGRGESAPARPSGRVRNPEPLNYPPKVADTQTYAGQRVTGVRIGRGNNVTGDEPGAAVQVTGSQYIGKETGFNPREGGIKVGAARTTAGLVVTGTQVRSKVRITGDESNASLRITGEADQEIADDLVNRREQGAYASMQFQRQHNPHGHTVFGTNLGRSAKSVGSRERDTTQVLEQTEDGLPISGTAVGRSVRVTGDESGSCRPITGDQYLMPANKQTPCDTPGCAPRARAGRAMTMNGRRPDPVTGEKVTLSESWTRQRITGVDVEHNTHVTGDEPGVCAPITGTPYVGPGQYESFCTTDDAKQAQCQRVPSAAGGRVTGDTPLNVQRVTGTQRGAERAITGTSYYREEQAVQATTDTIGSINERFSVRSPQREAQLRADVTAAQAPSAESRITGAFAVGHGKITGNQEFHFSPRERVRRDEDKSRITGEGRMEGHRITGGAWSDKLNVTGTEGYIAAERNPSERAGKPMAFSNSTVNKSKGKHEPARQIVTGMVGWSAKSAAKVTLSGGAQG